MKIALFTDSFDFYKDYVDGIAVIAQRFADYASRKRIHLEIFTVGEENSAEVLSKTVKVHRFRPKIRWYMPWYYEAALDLVMPRKEIVDYFRDNRFDIIHFTLPTPLCTNALFLGGVSLPRFLMTAPSYCASLDLPGFMKRKSPFKIPLVGSFHSDVPAFVMKRTRSGLLTSMFEDFINHFYRNCSLILATSEGTRKKIRGYMENRKMGILLPGVDTGLFSPKRRSSRLRKKFKDRIILLHAGRIAPEKNIRFLVDAYKKLLERHKSIHLVLAGSGSMERHVKKELKGRATLAGFVNSEQLAEIYASSDIFVFPSTTDTLGLVVLEAQASGLPVVVSDAGGPKEVMTDGKTGFVTKANDIDDFVGKTEILIKDERLRRQMGVAAMRLAGKYTWDRVFDDLARKYRGVIKDATKKTKQNA